jgi:hypothetical protein
MFVILDEPNFHQQNTHGAGLFFPATPRPRLDLQNARICVNLHGFSQGTGYKHRFLPIFAPETLPSISCNFVQKIARKGADSRNFRLPGRLFQSAFGQLSFWVFAGVRVRMDCIPANE